MLDWIIAFFVYSYLGASVEHINYNLLPHTKVKALTNPIITGFPLYGIGVFLLLGLHHYVNDYSLIIQFFTYAIILSLLEFIVGMIVGAGKTSYENHMVSSWNYSKNKFNFMGLISLKHFILWGVVGLIIVKIHPKIM